MHHFDKDTASHDEHRGHHFWIHLCNDGYRAGGFYNYGDWTTNYVDSDCAGGFYDYGVWTSNYCDGDFPYVKIGPPF
jgi:hypothetical protein